MTQYLDTKTKRIIDRTTGTVVGVIAYRMSADYTHMNFAISQKHPQDVANLEVGKALATQRVEALTRDSAPTKFTGSIDVNRLTLANPDIKNQKLVQETGLKYISINSIFNGIYEYFGVPTSHYR